MFSLLLSWLLLETFVGHRRNSIMCRKRKLHYFWKRSLVSDRTRRNTQRTLDPACDKMYVTRFQIDVLRHRKTTSLGKNIDRLCISQNRCKICFPSLLPKKRACTPFRTKRASRFVLEFKIISMNVYLCCSDFLIILFMYTQILC